MTNAQLLTSLAESARCAFLIHTSEMESADSRPASRWLGEFAELFPKVQAVDWRQFLPPERAATLVAAVGRLRDLMTLVFMEEDANRPVADRTPIFDSSHETLRTLTEAAAIVENTPAPAATEPIERQILDANGVRISQVASDRRRTANERMQDIVGIDRSWAGRTSSEWASLLGVSEQAIRRTATWNLIQRGRAE